MESPLIFLIVVLSVFLALFLLLGIVLLIKCIQIANRVKEVTERTHQVIGKLDGIADVVKKASGSIAIGKLVAKAFERIGNKDNQTKEEEK